MTLPPNQDANSWRSTCERCLTVVGGGATGVQYLFEIAHFLRERRISCRLRLVDAEPAPLRQFPSKLGRYVEARISDLEIDYLPNCFFRSQASGRSCSKDGRPAN